MLRLAGEHNIDLEQVEGTGAGGRITRKDIQRIIASGAVPQTDAAPEKQPGANAAGAIEPDQNRRKPHLAAPPQSAAGDVEIPVTGIRNAIATNMVRSKHEIPHAWTMMEVDVTGLVSYRNKIKTNSRKRGLQPDLFAFLSKQSHRR